MNSAADRRRASELADGIARATWALRPKDVAARLLRQHSLDELERLWAYWEAKKGSRRA